MTLEIWEPVVGFYSTHYCVSNLGRVKRIERKILTVCYDKNGYPQVALSKDSSVKTKKIHILVAEAFLGVRPAGYVINHKDGVKTNNNVENLEWVTSSRNNYHSFENGLHSSKLSVEKAKEIRNKLSTGESKHLIAREMGVSYSQVYRVEINAAWPI